MAYYRFVAASKASTAKEGLLRWCRNMTSDYANVAITNFTSSWSDGLAFCALLHHFMPHLFDYGQLRSVNRRYNFELAFRLAELVFAFSHLRFDCFYLIIVWMFKIALKKNKNREKADIVSLLDVSDMIQMGDSPDWKCVFTYVHSIYLRFKDSS